MFNRTTWKLLIDTNNHHFSITTNNHHYNHYTPCFWWLETGITSHGVRTWPESQIFLVEGLLGLAALLLSLPEAVPCWKRPAGFPGGTYRDVSENLAYHHCLKGEHDGSVDSGGSFRQRCIQEFLEDMCYLDIYLVVGMDLFNVGRQLGMNIQLYQLIGCENLYVDS